jgi:hypothetical protein
MFSAADSSTITPLVPTLVTRLPGPGRKRSESLYHYRLTYRDPRDGAVGCVMIWEVSGGRLPYQVALERDDAGSLHVHCTCADAIFRAEGEGRFCKHVEGLLQIGQPDAAIQGLDAYRALGA